MELIEQVGICSSLSRPLRCRACSLACLLLYALPRRSHWRLPAYCCTEGSTFRPGERFTEIFIYAELIPRTAEQKLSTTAEQQTRARGYQLVLIRRRARIRERYVSKVAAASQVAGQSRDVRNQRFICATPNPSSYTCLVSARLCFTPCMISVTSIIRYISD